jgi:uncharacterized oxidoreductase
MIVMAPELRAYVSDIFIAGGSQPGEAKIIADHLVDANLTGHDSHGIAMIPSYVKSIKDGTVSPNSIGGLAREDGPILVYDGARGWGQVVAKAATEIAIKTARKTGVALLALRNAHHIGRVGAYGEQCATAGLVSIHFVNATGHWPRVAPYGGRDARLPTNPLCVAIPGDDKQPPLILDMATSRTALGKVRVARNSGEQYAPGYLLDANGEPTTDPSVMFDERPGSLLPVGEHKGYGLALVCEILAGAFTEGGTIQPANKRGGTPMNSMMTIVFDPARTSNLDWARREIDDVISYVKDSPRQSADNPVLIPGDPERIAKAQRTREGIIVDEGTWAGVVSAAAALGVYYAERKAG